MLINTKETSVPDLTGKVDNVTLRELNGFAGYLSCPYNSLESTYVDQKYISQLNK
jgi:hypothetical protein